jgi:uncharacterized protein (DUF488 family)
MPGTLYTVGYQSGHLSQALELVANGNCRLFDIRFNPYSPNPRYTRAALSAAAGSAYEHLQSLGNINYRNGGPITLLDEARGIARLVDTLESGLDAIVLCACKNLSTCHRNVVAAKIAARGFAVVHF